MSEGIPPEAAFDSNGNPLFTADGNLASAADAAEYPNLKLYVYGETRYSGIVYDGRGHQVRGAGGSGRASPGSSPHSVDDAIGQVAGGLATAAILGFFLVLSGPLDKLLMGLAKEQTARADELEAETASVNGLNFGGLFAGIFLWLWPFIFLRFRFALIVFAFLTVVPGVMSGLVPLCGMLFGILLYLLMWGLIVVRGNEWAWYSGRWATVDDLMTAKRWWAFALIGLYLAVFVFANAL